MNKKKLKASVSLALIFLLFSGMAGAKEEIAVIVNSSNSQEIDKNDVKNIFSEKVTKWSNGQDIAVYNLPENSEPREQFSRDVLGMSARRAASEEANRIITNSAKNPGSTKRQRLLVSLVSKRPNSIGYARKSMVEGRPGVRIVLTIN